MAAAVKLPNDEEAEKTRFSEPEVKKKKPDEFFVDLYEEYKQENPQVVQLQQ